MSNLTPSDVHVLTEVNSEGVVCPKKNGKQKFAASMDNERKVRNKNQKRKVKQIQYTPDWVEKMHVQKKFHSAANRRKMKASGNALPNGSYPIGDTEDLKNAATLARSGHGDVGAAKRLIARRAKELGAKNPLAAKSSVDKSADVFESAVSCFSGLTE
jgi:hypothetical protein